MYNTNNELKKNFWDMNNCLDCSEALARLARSRIIVLWSVDCSQKMFEVYIKVPTKRLIIFQNWGRMYRTLYTDHYNGSRAVILSKMK